MKCSTPLQVSENVHYFQCHTCNTMFHLHWSNGKIDRQRVLENISQRMEAGFSEEDLQFSARELQVKLRSLNDTIRNVEMAKGAERIRVMAILFLIIAVIYLLFRVTVSGLPYLMEPKTYELVAFGLIALSLFVIILFKIYKAVMVSKVNKLIVERDELSEELQRVEATMDLQAEAPPQKPEAADQGHQGKDIEPREKGNDIIEKFATRKKEGRKRLNLRDD